MGFQIPKANHPWRRYANREVEVVRKKKETIKPVRVLVEELVGNWEHIEVFTVAYGREGKFYLFELPQSRQAAWLAGLLKRNYGQ